MTNFLYIIPADFLQGATPSTPASGKTTVYANSTDLLFHEVDSNGHDRTLASSLPGMTTGSTTGTSEVVLGTLTGTISANEPTVGSCWRAIVWGTQGAASGTPSISLNLKLDNTSGSALATSGTITASSGSTKGWYMEVTWYITATGSGGTCETVGITTWSSSSRNVTTSNSSALAFNTTTSHNIVLTGNFTATGTTPTLTTTAGLLERLA